MMQGSLSFKPSPSAIQRLLQWLGGPFRWWFTPRSTGTDEAFRERCLRWMLPINVVFHSLLLISEMNALGAIPSASLTLYGMAAVASISTMVLLLMRRINLAGYVLAVQAVLSYALDSTLLYWSPVALGRAAFTMLLFALILPKDKYLFLFVVLQYLAFTLHIVFPTSPSLLPDTEPYSTQLGTLVASTLIYLAGGGIVTFLLRQYSRQRDQLKDMVGTLEDRVRERTHELEQAKDVAEADRVKAEEADRIKSQFLASMSHELRTPLNAILNFTEMMALGMIGPVSEIQADVLNKSLDSGRHLLSLINDVLDISKMQSGMLTLFVENDINLQEELGAVIATAESLFKNDRVRFVRDIENPLPLISGDKRRIRQILLNLISNAVKFTDKGSVTLSARCSTDTITLKVADTGPGIAKDQQAIIFQPFVQTETGIRHTGGTGLGLPIARNLAEAHGGHLWVESEPGRGSAFYVTLPIRSA